MFEVDILVMAQSDKHQFSFHDREENLLGLLGPDPGGSQRSPSTYMTTDPYGRPLVRVKKGMTSLVLESASQQLGSVGQANLTTLQKLRFNFIANYQTIGTMEGKSWSDDASLIILDLDGEKVGTVDKVRLSSDSIRQRLSTKHDRYLMKFENECDPHLRTLATYSALMLDVIRSNK